MVNVCKAIVPATLQDGAESWVIYHSHLCLYGHLNQYHFCSLVCIFNNKVVKIAKAIRMESLENTPPFSRSIVYCLPNISLYGEPSMSHQDNRVLWKWYVAQCIHLLCHQLLPVGKTNCFQENRVVINLFLLLFRKKCKASKRRDKVVKPE